MTLPIIEISHDLENEVTRGIDGLFMAGVSDITIQSDDYIWAYYNRVHTRASNTRLDDSQVTRLIRLFYHSEGGLSILGKGEPLDFECILRPRLDPSRSDFDVHYNVRCRANITRCRVGGESDGNSITLRTIPGLPPKIETLNLPAEIVDNLFPSGGLVLVVGITGSGKSTLLASANRHRLESEDSPVKILTFEDPVEFVFARAPAIYSQPGQPPVGARMPEVSQVQLGTHMKLFSQVAPNILRRKGDVIIVGEMRDKESIDTALLLANTGHATYGTLHTRTPAQAIARIVNQYATDEQPAIANNLLDNIRLIVAQKIQRDVSGKGRAFRSWCVFDLEFKDQLSEHPYEKWSRLVNNRMESLGQTFAQQAWPALKAGEITTAVFGDLADMNPAEVRRFMAKQEQGARDVS